MALPFFLGAIAAVAGLGGVGKGVKGAIDTKDAKEVQDRAERIIVPAKDRLLRTKEKTTKTISDLGKMKLQTTAKELNDFVNIYSNIKGVDLTDSVGKNELSKLRLTKENMKEIKDASLNAIDVLGGGITGVGAGVLLGWGTYGSVMALGTASTGAAIGGLSGVAAKNATLAWLGGGALKVGGGGIALGMKVLGGVITGPALLVAGIIYGAKAKEKLNNAYSNLAEAKRIEAELKTAETELKIIEKNARQFNKILCRCAEMLGLANIEMQEIVNKSTKWSTYSKDEKNTVIVAMKSAQIVKSIIDVPLLTNDGILTKEIRDTLNDPKLLSSTGITEKENRQYYCKVCNNQVNPNKRFCTKCGSEVTFEKIIGGNING